MSDKMAIELHNVSYTFKDEIEPAIQDINFAVQQGEWVSIVGPGGSGKTTLCELLCGALQYWPGGLFQGKIQVGGHDMSEVAAGRLAEVVGVVFQDPDSGLIHEYVEDELAFGPENLFVAPDEIEKRIQESLLSVDFPEARQLRTSELSGGQKQRISIASVLTLCPKIFIFDNVSANLDASAAKKLVATLRKLHDQGHTLITASSRMDDACSSDRVIILEKGRLIVDGSRARLNSDYNDILTHLGCVPCTNEVKYTAKLEEPSLIKSEPLLQVKQLSFEYPTRHLKENKFVLNNVHINLYKNDILAVMGPNGSGKTTFGKLLVGLLPPPQSSIWIHGRDVTACSVQEMASTVGYLFQNPEHQFVTDTVWDECVFGLIQTGQKSASHSLGEQILRRFGLYAYRDLSPYRLSAADKQLLNLASTLILQPDLVILDEPTAGLDYAKTDLFMSHCANYAHQGKAVLFITHDTYAAHRWSNIKLFL